MVHLYTWHDPDWPYLTLGPSDSRYVADHTGRYLIHIVASIGVFDSKTGT